MRQVYLRGRLGADAEMSYTQQGTALAKFSVAVNEKREEFLETHWFRVNVWGKTAEEKKDQLIKGAYVNIIGTLNSRSWKDSAGKTCSAVEVTAFILDVLPKKEDCGIPL